MSRFAIAAVLGFVVLLGLSAVAGTFKECGWKALLLGSGAGMAAMAGMCDE